MTNQSISGGVVHTMPADLKELLVSDRAALAVWESLTPLARNEWICWAISVKRPETRLDHIQRIQSQLKEGARRPCCWYGCIHRTDKKVSPSVQALVVEKKRTR